MQSKLIRTLTKLWLVIKKIHLIRIKFSIRNPKHWRIKNIYLNFKNRIRKKNNRFRIFKLFQKLKFLFLTLSCGYLYWDVKN